MNATALGTKKSPSSFRSAVAPKIPSFRLNEIRTELQAIGAGVGGWNRERSISGMIEEEFLHQFDTVRTYDVGISTEQLFRYSELSGGRKTKIICAIGPPCRSQEMLGKLLDAGMNVARLNFSHGTHEYHQESLDNLRAAQATRRGIHCAVLLDTKGPELRTGLLKNHGPIHLVSGQELEITTDYSLEGDNSRITCNYPDLPTAVKPGSAILCADGSLTLTVLRCLENSVITRVENSITLEETKNFYLPGARVNLPPVTEKDIDDIVNFAIPNRVDLISTSFVRNAEHIRAIRNVLGPEGRDIRVNAKIESLEALENFDEILKEADGIHVSRGDLGMELPPQKVFLAQKMIIRKANIAGKPVVTSTQMLESMINNPVPTFAEASDVANAVIDGTDAVMLSGETAKGKHPVESVLVMSRILKEAEAILNYDEMFIDIRDSTPKPVDKGEAVASSAVATAIDTKARVIVVLSETGYTARCVAKYRPKVPIVAVTTSARAARQMAGLSRGVHCLVVESMIGSDTLLNRGILFALNQSWILPGDMAVGVHGYKEGLAGTASIVKVIRVSANF